jgi:hypothetical protein
MKLLLPMVLLTLLGCNNAKKEIMSMPGAYNMLSQTLNDGKKDTVYTTLREFKIYTDDYMMYVYMNPADSGGRFGIGYYTADSGKVTENVIYGATDTTFNDKLSRYHLVIEKTPKGYKQVIADIVSDGVNYRLTEEYESVGTPAKSAMDGAWKQTKHYTVSGKDTVVHKLTQFKAYYAGHFMFGQTYRDSLGKFHTGIGYGSFTMNGANKVKEHVTTATHYQARGQSFDLDIEMPGKDEYKQTITNADGSKDVEEYVRLKK